MRPVLIRWPGVRVYSYPTMLYLGLVVASVATMLLATPR